LFKNKADKGYQDAEAIIFSRQRSFDIDMEELKIQTTSSITSYTPKTWPTLVVANMKPADDRACV
jgi:hypothetical protein